MDRLSKNRSPSVILVTVLFLLTNVPLRAENRSITIRVGHQFFLETKDLRRIAIGNPEIIEVSSIDNGKGILLAGKKKGETDILLWEKKNRNVITVDVVDELMDRETQMNDELLKILLNLGIKEPDIKKIGKVRIVTGYGDSETIKKAKNLLKNFNMIIPEIKEFNFRKKEIIFELKFLEISKGSLKSIGVNWPASTEVKVEFEKGGNTRATVESSIGIMLKSLISDGRARILANPVLVCKEGESASFLAGGEVPVVIIGDEKREVVWKKYGIILNLQNSTDTGGAIVTRVTAEVSTLDHSTGTSDIPGLITRRVDTSFQLTSGKTIILSGLVKNDSIKDVSKFPLLSNIPILGELFKSRNFRNNYSELIITITPTILDEFDSRSFAGRFQKKFEAMKDELRFNFMD